jgi:hypothetical protein
MRYYRKGPKKGPNLLLLFFLLLPLFFGFFALLAFLLFVGLFLFLYALDNLLINLDIFLKSLRLLLFAVSLVFLLKLFFFFLVKTSLLGQVGVHLLIGLLGVLALHRWLLHYMPFFLGIACFLPFALAAPFLPRSIEKSSLSSLPFLFKSSLVCLPLSAIISFLCKLCIYNYNSSYYRREPLFLLLLLLVVLLLGILLVSSG